MKRSASHNTDSDYSDSVEDDSSANSSAQHEQLKSELRGHVKYDDRSVFKRLRIDEEEAAIVDRCHEIYQVEQMHNLEVLRGVAGDLSKALQGTDDERDESTKNRKRKEKEKDVEKKMYGPLQNIFMFLQNFENGNSSALREFKCAANTALLLPPARAAEAYTPGTANFRPDFNLLDKITDRPFWDSCAGFAEVKVQKEENDPPRDETVVKPVILQCADYARYHMAFRPFWNFSVTLLITGTVFRVMIVDHDGVILSPRHSIYDDSSPQSSDHHQRDAKTFVRVVRALTRRVTNHQLGQDPSVTPVARNELERYLRLSPISPTLRSKIRLEGGDHYPSYHVSRFGNESGTWCTIGPPIWVSLSLLGRGTEVWRVLELQKANEEWVFVGDIHILKSAWRNPLKLAETDIYGHIKGLKHKADTDNAPGSAVPDAERQPPFPPGIATHRYGSDVCYYEDQRKWTMITTAHIRGRIEDPERPSKVLHRIILPMVGEPLWKYTDELQLLNAFYAIVEAHKYLCENGILHRDISAGNMLLWPGGDAAGFLSDFDMAHVDRSLIDNIVIREAVNPVKRGVDSGGRPIMTEGSVRSRIDYTSSRPQGVAVTGTLQFMALQLLQAVHDEAIIPHVAAHDLESIANVLGYTVLRRLVSTPDCPESLEKVFKTVFGGTTVPMIAGVRYYGEGGVHDNPLSWAYRDHRDIQRAQFTAAHISSPLAVLLYDLQFKVKEAYDIGAKRHGKVHLSTMYDDIKEDTSLSEEPITHAFFLDLLKQAISTLENDPSKVKRFNPEQEILRPLSVPQSGSDKPPKKKLKANE
ncbi:hypothetical protein DAEQUDRAFT_758692 [Daedalea quercina L-15889]|uniref:Fungal-type protein kinase domain-containing protein n=1 Tax=Daedalea quercina L-15889 TaxID=1314783 RepID=A0A165N6Q4_9APHY|nr:hypothetical protein DAEQUDRAFT_758692 [Daedalea quercina L-15889]